MNGTRPLTDNTTRINFQSRFSSTTPPLIPPPPPIAAAFIQNNDLAIPSQRSLTKTQRQLSSASSSESLNDSLGKIRSD